jgi:hypothetical protein
MYFFHRDNIPKYNIWGATPVIFASGLGAFITASCRKYPYSFPCMFFFLSVFPHVRTPNQILEMIIKMFTDIKLF